MLLEVLPIHAQFHTYSLSHTDTSITDGKGFILFVGDNVDTEILASVKLTRVGEGLISDLVEGIRAIRNQLSQEDLLVRVDCVDN